MKGTGLALTLLLLAAGVFMVWSGLTGTPLLATLASIFSGNKAAKHA